MLKDSSGSFRPFNIQKRLSRKSFRKFQMIWLLLITQLGAIAMAEPQQFLSSSLPDAVRVGATIVSRFLNPKPPQIDMSGFYNFKGTGNDEGQDNGFILTILRLMGIDSRKINDFAFDGIISMVHLMSRVLLKDGRNRRTGKKSSKDFSSFRFILGQPKVTELLKDVQNPNLINLLLKESQEKLKNFPETNVDCIHLLLCKTKPFVRGMQRSLRFFMNRENITASSRKSSRENHFLAEEETCRKETREESCQKDGEDVRWEEETVEGRMFFFLPALNDVIKEGDECDTLFPNCVY